MMEWIKCEERLPLVDELVLICKRCNDDFEIEVGWRENENSTFIYHCNKDEKLTFEPDYWMPLPEPPKEDW
ncbi:DUF551 domain-containing protein [Arsenophonus apicola]|uniref:DUF551 domain-containing protein n=1 Tax=Arsenophonus apicola TaxID=2879119 RepID=UPI001CDC61FE|nr:DUF551 domain-containing protein [Arsenophonus apicola]UBX27930.1 DUF551 domain-containing protein [Arsenophonus apicola]UBX28491.1 DUF551 domain-containing protein [Arsenophonus apicola]UBX30851.1 DUF551 domain-containing protein [Arsenophonus apicola]